MQKKTDQNKPNFLQVIGSVLSALFGVQSNKARERDFQHGSPIAYIVVGIVVVALLVLMLWLIVKLVLP